MCDISFMTEDFLDLDALAREHETTVVADCGVAPGMSNMLSSWGVSKLDHAERVEILVEASRNATHPGVQGRLLPLRRDPEYVRPSRVVEHGRHQGSALRAGTDRVPGVGTWRRSTPTDCVPRRDPRRPHMGEDPPLPRAHRPRRRPARRRALQRGAGRGRGRAGRPRALLAKLLFPKWTYEPMEEDLTVMQVTVEGDLDGVPTRFRWDLFDAMDPGTGFSTWPGPPASPARWRGSCSTARSPARVFAPEHIATDEGVLDKVLAGLAGRTSTTTRASNPRLTTGGPVDGPAPIGAQGGVPCPVRPSSIVN